jgi:alanine-glyoxylate transaminase/serine-glyoxylate transaminase/serine-pyruvate transaminase
VWRIGLMGHSCNLKNVLLCVGAFETILANEGAAVEIGVAEAAAQKAFAG